MKKIYILMMLVIAGTMAMAQTSVWDGSRAIWTRGNGTSDDPYRIESAKHLAFLAYMVNKGFDTEGLYFKLCTDIDLNGSEGQQWVPIGLGDRWFNEDGCNRGRPHANPRTTFRGHFDGGDHRICDIYIDNSEGIYGYVGLFGTAEGVIEGEEVFPAVIENVFVTSGTIIGGNCGGIVGNGYSTTTVSRCWNGADIDGSGDVGGIGNNCYQVNNCYNIGTISGNYAGGIIGFGQPGKLCSIAECSNEGTISGTCAGGIFGHALNKTVTINNCYNKGNIDADGEGEGGAAGPTAGGIAAVLFRGEISITNCYNIGAISSTKDAGCILAFGTGTLENNYYINTCDAGGEGEAVSEEFMRSQDFVDRLNGIDRDNVWAFDENNVNDGYPILVGNDLVVNEMTKELFNVYPNPAQGQFTVKGSGTVIVRNLLGQTLLTRKIDGQTSIQLPKGLYFVTLGVSTQKIVVE